MKYLALFLILFNVTTKPSYLFIGDSITSYQDGWQKLVCKMKDANCTNLSQPNKTTDWMLQQLQQHLLSKKHYDVVFIYGGINDAFGNYNIDQSYNNVKKMVELVQSKKMVPVVIIGYDAEKVISDTYIIDKKIERRCIDSYVAYQKKLQQLNVKTVYVLTLSRSNTFDGIHPNESGHLKIATQVIGIL